MPPRRVLICCLALAASLVAVACAAATVEVPAVVTPFVPGTFTATLTGALPATPAPATPAERGQEATAEPATPTELGQAATPTRMPAPTVASPTPTPTVMPVTYSVVAGDVFYNIAARFGLTAEQLLDANPGLDPAVLYPGDVLIIPDPATRATADARVRLNGGGLRVRAWPDLAAEVVATLPALTRLDLHGRSADNDWVQVTSNTGASGWVPALWLDLRLALVVLPVTAPDAPPPSATPPPEASYISNVNLRMLRVFQRGQALGNRADVFSKVGDSITVSTAFLVPIGVGNYRLGAYADLQGVIDFFSAGEARGGLNAFENRSLAAKVGWRARAVFGTGGDPLPDCEAGERPLLCEYRVVRPAVALIMLGTNDVPYTPAAEYDSDVRRILDLTLEQGVIPVLSTIPPFTRAGDEGRAEELNVIVRTLALEYGVPLLDYYAAMTGLPGQGIGGDGVHPTTADDTRNADFSPDHLQFGMVMRNLTALYALNEVWTKIITP